MPGSRLVSGLIQTCNLDYTPRTATDENVFKDPRISRDYSLLEMSSPLAVRFSSIIGSTALSILFNGFYDAFMAYFGYFLAFLCFLMFFDVFPHFFIKMG